MTTICCNLKIMAADRKTVAGDLYFPSTKIFRFRGDIVGAAGDAGDCEMFLEWFDKQRGKPPKIQDENFDAIVLTKKGILTYDQLCVPLKVDRGFHAIGSGALGALVAMQDGADPKTAIEKVAMFENNTSPETDVLEL
ncbi:MAG: hypothetical protein ACRENT_06670 [Thermodesulfobacteriota bacterium]